MTVFDCKLDDLLPKPNKRVKDGIQSAELVLVTSQEIDELCEADNIAQPGSKWTVCWDICGAACVS